MQEMRHEDQTAEGRQEVNRRPTPFKAPPGCLTVLRGLIIAAGILGVVAVVVGAPLWIYLEWLR